MDSVVPDKDKTYGIIGAAMSVHTELGMGFLEAVYGDALAIELERRHIPFEREKSIHIMYKGQKLNHYYVADFLCYGDIIVELKAVEQIQSVHMAQVLNYLSATGYKLALLINFGEKSLKYKRIVN
ncbi:MAG: GxxExxY protein [Prevotella sp.]|nr:GxxExxY protein [Prevotella sp.]